MKRAVKSGAVKPKQLAERCENVIYSDEELQIMGDNSSHLATTLMSAALGSFLSLSLYVSNATLSARCVSYKMHTELHIL